MCAHIFIRKPIKLYIYNIIQNSYIDINENILIGTEYLSYLYLLNKYKQNYRK